MRETPAAPVPVPAGPAPDHARPPRPRVEAKPWDDASARKRAGALDPATNEATDASGNTSRRQATVRVPVRFP